MLKKGQSGRTHLLNFKRESLAYGALLPDTINRVDSYVPSFQQHLNIMRSTYELLTSDFVEIEMAFRDCV